MKGKTFAAALAILFIGLSTIIQISPGAIKDNNPFLNQSINPSKYILFTPEYSKDTYLINDTGEIVKTWHSNYLQGLAVYLLGNGDLIRSDSTGTNLSFTTGGFTGHVEKFNWDGTLNWEFEYSTDTYCLHHDIEPLPNGNILMIAWEKKNETETLAAGREPYPLGNNILWPDHIIEVKPQGTLGGTIVWEWHVWDHLIQDYDATKANFGNVSQHPELIDINYKPHGGGRPDFNHINSIDYQEEYDQILLSVSEFSEIWIIDHSTTTLQAASHTGGNSGKGGDILYRWGNPQTYRAGEPYDQKLFEQHDARWIETGCPGEGHILVYNNGLWRPAGRYSSVEEIIPPVDSNGSYFHAPGSPYGPENPTWTYTADNPTTLFSKFLSGAQRLPNGNTLICDGPQGFFFEVTPDKEIIWEYQNPFPNPFGNQVFKIQCYYLSLFEPDLTCNHTLKWLDKTPGETIRDTFSLQNDGGFDSFLDWKIESWPEWGQWIFTPISRENLTREDGAFNVDIELVVPTNGTNPFTGDIKIANQDNPDDFALIPVHLTLHFTPQLWCNGTLNWTNVIPGDTIFSTINIKNIGDPDSLLNWKIETWPEWGNWTFLPNTGKNLTTTDKPLNLTVLVTAPLIAEKEFTGHIKIANTENTTNYTLLNTSLTTTHNPHNTPPIADFHWIPPDNLNTHQNIHFIDDSNDNDGTLITWHWDFDDDTATQEQHPLHTYNSTGTYNVTLTVTDNNGSQSSKTKQITITNLSPQADAGPDQIINTTHATLNGTGSHDPDGEITLYTWHFGDGTNTTGPHVTHTYPTDGLYIATLTVTDNNEATNSDTCTITIDTTPPKTTPKINGTKGKENWYTSTVTIQLHYNDTLPGAHETYYQTNQDEWKTYQKQLNLSNEGTHTLSFYSTDSAGNTEEPQNITIKIDKTPPHILITSPKKGYLHILGRAIIPTWRDNTLIIGEITVQTNITSHPSGIHNVTFYVNNALQYSTAQPPYTWNWEKGFGKSTLKIICHDNAGHNQDDEINVSIFSIH